MNALLGDFIDWSIEGGVVTLKTEYGPDVAIEEQVLKDFLLKGFLSSIRKAVIQ